ncbi:DUF4255 domain-containing protein [Maribacter sp. IgM3_T14_3]|uniref:DUF4255 domain-containing protein n=1 Tax=Maribacter sp. IgM3_T14_3 TaxID=3415140 RepID=UPI003C6FBA35
MIHTVLEYVRDRLKKHFRNEFSGTNVKVVLSNLDNANGLVVDKTANSIVFFLINVTEETTLKNNLNRSVSAGQNFLAKKQAPLHLNFQIMFCANFSEGNYLDGLNYLSSIIHFFHVHPKLDCSPIKDKENSIGKLTFELCTLDYGEISQVWSAIGSKLTPSLIYKVNILVFEDKSIPGKIPAIESVQNRI